MIPDQPNLEQSPQEFIGLNDCTFGKKSNSEEEHQSTAKSSCNKGSIVFGHLGFVNNGDR